MTEHHDDFSPVRDDQSAISIEAGRQPMEAPRDSLVEEAGAAVMAEDLVGAPDGAEVADVAAPAVADADEPGDAQPGTNGERRSRRGRGRRGRGRGRSGAGEPPRINDPIAQEPAASRPPRRARGVLPPEDPFWQFGTPVELWGSTVQRNRGVNGTGGDGSRNPAPRRGGYLECKRCGVKFERRAHHRDRVACPMCGMWMVAVQT